MIYMTIGTNLLQMRKMVIQEARMTNTNTNRNTNLLHMRKMVIQEARMTRQSTATITDMRWR